MGIFQVVNERRKLVSRQGVKGEGCPRCGGPVLAMKYDTQLLIFCIPFPHKTKTRFCCVVCSTRLSYSS
ncbi:hypothetical protein ACS0TY_035546 [Phlomoides rotata]